MEHGHFDHESARRLLIDHFVSDWRDVLATIPLPTWVVAGGLEPYYNRAGMKWFAAAIPQGELTMLKKSGHSPHVSEATEFNARLLAFSPHESRDLTDERSAGNQPVTLRAQEQGRTSADKANQ